MPDRIDPATPPQDTGSPDPVETDPVAHNSAEDLDEDRLRQDPLEEGMDPPERWSEADRWGMTPFEQSQGEPLDSKLAQEEPEDQTGGITGDEPTPAQRRGQEADEAGGSVAEAIRTPDTPG